MHSTCCCSTGRTAYLRIHMGLAGGGGWGMRERMPPTICLTRWRCAHTTHIRFCCKDHLKENGSKVSNTRGTCINKWPQTWLPCAQNRGCGGGRVVEGGGRTSDMACQSAQTTAAATLKWTLVTATGPELKTSRCGAKTEDRKFARVANAAGKTWKIKAKIKWKSLSVNVTEIWCSVECEGGREPELKLYKVSKLSFEQNRKL